MTPQDYIPRVRLAWVSKHTGTWSGELDDLLALDEGLSDWEVSFIDSVNDMRREHGSVTPKQVLKIRQIWDEKVKET